MERPLLAKSTYRPVSPASQSMTAKKELKSHNVDNLIRPSGRLCIIYPRRFDSISTEPINLYVHISSFLNMLCCKLWCSIYRINCDCLLRTVAASRCDSADGNVIWKRDCCWEDHTLFLLSGDNQTWTLLLWQQLSEFCSTEYTIRTFTFFCMLIAFSHRIAWRYANLLVHRFHDLQTKLPRPSLLISFILRVS